MYFVNTIYNFMIFSSRNSDIHHEKISNSTGGMDSISREIAFPDSRVVDEENFELNDDSDAIQR